MDGYVGASKKDIENLIESVQEPGVSVQRERRTKRAGVFAGVPNVFYHFSKDGKRLFSICVAVKYGCEDIKMSIMCGGVFSDIVREGDDGYRKACVLYQLAERMYEMRYGKPIKALNLAAQLRQTSMFCKMALRTK
jgi:hypothetical protein